MNETPSKEQRGEPAREWLIRKRGYYYRPNRAGYTSSVAEAGRYTEAEAKNEAALEPWHITALHQSEVEGGCTVTSNGNLLTDALSALNMFVAWEDGTHETSHVTQHNNAMAAARAVLLRSSHETSNDPAPSAMRMLTAALQADPDYAWAWHCNLAMPIMDRLKCGHEAANEAGAALMQHLFRIDISRHQHWQYARSQLEPSEPSEPRGKSCTCPDTSASACGVERGHKLGELWYCRRAAEKASAPRCVCGRGKDFHPWRHCLTYTPENGPAEHG